MEFIKTTATASGYCEVCDNDYGKRTTQVQSIETTIGIYNLYICNECIKKYNLDLKKIVSSFSNNGDYHNFTQEKKYLDKMYQKNIEAIIPSKKTKKIKAIELEATNKNGEIVLNIKICKEIETFFKKISKNEKQKSSAWFDKNDKNLKFYKLNETIENKLKNIDYNCFNNYGSGIIKEGRFNMAILRSVGMSQGITIKMTDLISYQDLKTYSEYLGKFTNKLYNEYINEKKVTATIMFEI